jgi:hypothetical protein
LLLAVIATTLGASAQMAAPDSTPASAAPPAHEEIEPAYLPGNLPPAEDFMFPDEPLPEPEGPQVIIPSEQNPSEVAADRRGHG